ncbi:zinc ribbon domain-containing protein [Lentilactobacillus raoultii]|uniref:Zinc ribbon domain-containing protein n=1 Tax=Lentilactobacillus raoultii TaxID=1987503 RepID=A0ABW3PKQ7_9LACO|nr:zinc ribbon domain-containing protein [Lentilactobacillus raoultii]
MMKQRLAFCPYCGTKLTGQPVTCPHCHRQLPTADIKSDKGLSLNRLFDNPYRTGMKRYESSSAATKKCHGHFWQKWWHKKSF